MPDCIHVRSTPEGPALGLTGSECSTLCNKVTLRDAFGVIATVEATEGGVTVTPAAGIEATAE